MKVKPIQEWKTTSQKTRKTDSEQGDDSGEENKDSDIEIELNNNAYIGKDKTTIWSKRVSPKNTRIRAHNIIKHMAGTKGEAKNTKSKKYIIGLFLDDRIIQSF